MKLSESDVFNLDILSLFSFTQDFEKRLQWDLQTKAIGFLEGHTDLKKGAMVYTESIEGVRMDTEYLVFEPPYELSIIMQNKSRVFKTFIGTWKFSEVTNTTTELKIIYQFELQFPFRLIALFVHKRIHKNMRNKLIFLSDFLKTIDLTS
ncbi:MAG: hypothetical protein ACPHXR_07445 [Flavicella sp.]